MSNKVLMIWYGIYDIMQQVIQDVEVADQENKMEAEVQQSGIGGRKSGRFASGPFLDFGDEDAGGIEAGGGAVSEFGGSHRPKSFLHRATALFSSKKRPSGRPGGPGSRKILLRSNQASLLLVGVVMMCITHYLLLVTNQRCESRPCRSWDGLRLSHGLSHGGQRG